MKFFSDSLINYYNFYKIVSNKILHKLETLYNFKRLRSFIEFVERQKKISFPRIGIYCNSRGVVFSIINNTLC